MKNHIYNQMHKNNGSYSKLGSIRQIAIVWLTLAVFASKVPCAQPNHVCWWLPRAADRWGGACRMTEDAPPTLLRLKKTNVYNRHGASVVGIQDRQPRKFVSIWRIAGKARAHLATSWGRSFHPEASRFFLLPSSNSFLFIIFFSLPPLTVCIAFWFFDADVFPLFLDDCLLQ